MRVSVWKAAELVFPHVPPAEDAHDLPALQVGDPVVEERGEGGGPRRLHHQPGAVEGGHGCPDLLVAHQDDALHVAATQQEGQAAWRGGGNKTFFQLVLQNRGP